MPKTDKPARLRMHAMSYRSKRKLVRAAVYGTLTLVILSVVCITVFTFVSANRKKKPPLEEPSSAAVSDAGNKPANKVKPPERSSDKPVKVDPVSPETSDVLEESSDAADTPTDTDPQPFFTLPLSGPVTRSFSIALPCYDETMGDYRAHAGVDLEAEPGTPVCAVAAGLIREVTDDPLWGRTVMIEHAGGLVSVYSNLMAEEYPGIAVGCTVGAGQPIGAVGDTALCEVAQSEHLHFALLRDGSYADPGDYLTFEE